MRTFSYVVSNGETVAKVVSNDYKQPEGTFRIGFKGQTTKEIIAKAFVASNKLPAGGTFSFFEFDPELGKADYARYEYKDVGGKQQARYFDAEYIDWMYGQLDIAQEKLSKGLKVAGAAANLAGAGILLKAEIKIASSELGAASKSVAVGSGSKLSNLQSTFENLAKEKLLPEYLKEDTGLKAGYTGSFKTGKVGNSKKSTYGQDINLESFDIDFWIESDVLYKKYGPNLKANPEFRKVLSETPGFEGLKPNKAGFSIKFKPSTKE